MIDATEIEAAAKAEGKRLLAFTEQEWALHRQRIAQVLVDLLLVAGGFALGHWL